MSRTPILSTVSILSDTAPDRPEPGLSVQVPSPYRQAFLPDNAMTGCNNARSTAISKPESASGTVLANNKDRNEEPGNADQPSRSASNQPLGRHRNKAEAETTCKLCNKTLGNQASLKRHIESVHNKEQRCFPCERCHKTFSRQDALNRHKINGHVKCVNHKKIFSCHICARSFQHRNSLRRHIDSHTDESQYHCEFCGKSFGCKEYRNQHKKIHDSNGQLRCNICHTSFGHKTHFKKHMMGHKNKREKQCKVCNQVFIDNRLLVQHMHSSHGLGKSYPCAICHAGFSTRRSLRRHSSNRHGITQDTITVTKTNKRENTGILKNIYIEDKEGNAGSEPDKKKICSRLEARSVHSELEEVIISSKFEEEEIHSEPEEGDADSEHTEEVPEDLKGRRDFPGKLTSMWTNIWTNRTNRSRSVFPAPGTTRTGLSPARAVGPFFSSSRKL